MTPSELASSLTGIFIRRDAMARVSISNEWALRVDGGRYSVAVQLSPEERTPETAVAAVLAASLWGRSMAEPAAAPTAAPAPAASRAEATPGIGGYDQQTTVVTFAEAPLDEAGRATIRDAILEELAQAAEEMVADVQGSTNGWWTIKLTRRSDRRSQAGVVSARTEQSGVLRKLTRSLIASLDRQRN
jgi:hypothetical protein